MTYAIPDGNDEIRDQIPLVVEMIAKTARWVHPDTFHALPIWCPWAARGRQLYDAAWSRKYTNTKRATGTSSDKVEGNNTAKGALVRAFGCSNAPKNWTVCHIWGYDDDTFATQGAVVQDPRYFSCVGNMVWLPTPLKGFTDALPAIKTILRACAFHLYGWACEHESVTKQTAEIRSGMLPDGYPSSWPTATERTLPLGTAPYSKRVMKAIDEQKERIRSAVANESLVHFPRTEVSEVLRFWNVTV